jgi:signal transduction histidine kinase
MTKLVQQWNATGLLVKFIIKGTVRPLTAQANLTLYRAAQEALTNIGKHAHATNIELLLSYANEHLVLLKVTDDGIGSKTEGDGFGLLGVRERVQLLNGQVRVNSEAGKGFSLEVEVPE